MNSLSLKLGVQGEKLKGLTQKKKKIKTLLEILHQVSKERMKDRGKEMM